MCGSRSPILRRAILNSDKPLLYVSALAGTGKSVVLGLLMDLMPSDDRHVIVLVPSRVLRDETVITHCQEAGFTEHDERILWLQLEERAAKKLEALSELKGIETTLREKHMELVHHKICMTDWQEVLPFSTCWSRSCQWHWPEPGSERRIAVTATCQNFKALYEDVLANVMECLESRAGRKWPGRHHFDIHEARSREAFLYAALGQHK